MIFSSLPSMFRYLYFIQGWASLYWHNKKLDQVEFKHFGLKKENDNLRINIKDDYLKEKTNYNNIRYGYDYYIPTKYLGNLLPPPSLNYIFSDI